MFFDEGMSTGFDSFVSYLKKVILKQIAYEFSFPILLTKYQNK